MSYILNALKKSEKQRQANQAESLESLILQQPLDEHKKAPNWLIILVFVNVCFLAYFIWSFLIEDESSEPLGKTYIKETANQITIDKPIQQSSINLAKKRQQTSISEQIEKQQKNISQPFFKPDNNNTKTLTAETKPLIKLLKKPVDTLETQKPIPPEITPIIVANKPASITQPIIKLEPNSNKTLRTKTKPIIRPLTKPIIRPLTKPVDTLETQQTIPPEITPIIVANKPASITQPIIKLEPNSNKTPRTKTKPIIRPLTKPVDTLETEKTILPKIAPIAVIDKPDVKDNIVENRTNDLPFLTEISSNFRRRVPSVDINVFVYSENEAERFIMIDMQKYQTGELIKSGLMLKEIRRNSLVVEYDGRLFQIKRK